MILSDICIRRPVFATVLNIMIVLVGVIAYNRLSVREYPKIEEPTVTVQTIYTGASAEIIESQVTKPLEDSLAGIEGIEVMSSISRQENSQITVRFKLSRDPDNAAADVRDRVSRARGNLPPGIKEPIISKVQADADPILYLAFYSDRHSAMEISDYADRNVRDLLQNLDGVANAMIFGDRKMSMRLWLDPEKLAAYGVTTQDVETALRNQNAQIPAGSIKSANREFTIVSQTDLRTPEEFNNMIVKRKGDSFVHFRDIGYAEIGPANKDVAARYNGKESVALGVVQQATANPLAVSREVNALLVKLKERLPEGMQIDIAYDTAVFIDSSINEVYHTLAEAFILVILVIFLFLRNVRSTMIPLVTIPISLIGTFALMYMMNFSVNTLTLLAMVLAIGLVVDDAIVVLENIYRHVEEGMDRIQASYKGSQEIAFAVIVMTLTLAAVYAPVAFIQARTGKLFIEFALTLAGAVLISGFTALTLSPMMCSILLRQQKTHGKFYNFVEAGIIKMNHGYAKLLNWALDHIKTVICIGLIIAGFGGLFFKLLSSELAPIEDRGTILVMAMAPEGSTVDYTMYWMEWMDPIFESTPEIEKYFIVGGYPVASQGIAFMRLKDWDDRKRKQQAIVRALQPKIYNDIPGILAFPVNPPSLGRNALQPIVFVVQTTGSYEELDLMVKKIMAEARKFPGIINLDTDLKLNKPQINVNVDREKASAVGVNVDTLGRTMETMFSAKQVTRFEREGKQYDVLLEVGDEERKNPNQVLSGYVRGANNKMIQIGNLVSIKETVAPRELNHFNQLRAAKLTANIAPGYTLGEALDYLDSIADSILPTNMQTDYDEESREFKESSSSLAITFVLALCFIYLVLAAQFESFISPFIIMLTVPLSISGALFALYMTGGTLNIYSEIGLITLIGLITKHGILIVEFSNQLHEKGYSMLDAIREACHIRLRPILMTTGAMVLGAIPLAIATGAGAESRNQIGWVIIGGMTVGTIFTLFIIPSIYALTKRKPINKA
jgi:multidrug efflux pump